MSSLKFAASDLDGTLFRNKKISAEDLNAIRNWRAAGNVFGLVTGRPFIMLKPIFETFGLEVDFAICDNGAIIHDGDGQIIFETELSKKILLDIMNEPTASKSYHFALEASDEFFCVVLSQKSWVLTEKSRWDFPLTILDAAQVAAIPKTINQIALGFDTPEEAQESVDALNQKFGAKIFAQRNYNSVDIVAAGINKSTGIEKILALRNWHGAEIFVIGDESNDLPMIKKFGGYTVVTAKDFVKHEAKAVVNSVGDMLNKGLLA